MKKAARILNVFILSLLLFITFYESVHVSAAEINTNDSEILYVTGYEVTNETITPGVDFTLTITVHNFSETAEASIAHVIVNNPDGVIPEYGTLSEGYIQSVKPQADATLSFNYTADSALNSKYLDFTVNVISANISSSSKIRIPVGRSTDFASENVSIPNRFSVSKTGYVSAMVTNLGHIGLSNVVMVARCDDEELASAKIGTMAAGTNKTQSLDLEFDNAGQYNLELVLTYTNAEGENKEYVITSTTVIVTEDEAENVGGSDITVIQGGNSGSGSNIQSPIGTANVILVCVAGIMLIVVCIIILLLIYRRK